MKELLQQADSRSEEASRERFVCLIVNATEYEYSGNWQWDLHCDAVFCSDVMLMQPQPFEGTRGLIHPDDKAYVADRLAPPDGTAIPFLQFRIITTYGEIKTLTGKNLQASEIGPFQPLPAPQPDPQLVADLSILEENQKLMLQKRAADLAERFTGTGTWYYNAGTGAVYYSDEVFRIHGLPRQSLNAHLGTFTSFIHPHDRDAVSEAFTRALKKQVPLHLEYRILAENGNEKRVHHAIHWEYSPAGHQVLYGTFQDITATYALEQSVQTAGFDLHFKNQLLHLNEQASQTGYWYVNLVTRKVFYSDAVYRLYGLKPGSVPPGGNIFLNYVHPDDRDLVMEVSKKILKQHVPPDLDFRVVRNDGKVRHLRQQGRIVVYGEDEMVMLVTMRDVTSEIITTQKLAELKQQVAVRQFAQLQSEDMAAMGSWWWDPETDEMTWSESLYRLLSVKPSGTNPTQKQLTRAIHPDDRKKFNDELQLTLSEKREAKFEFRIFRLGELRQVCASFKLMPFAEKEWFIGTLQDITPQHRLQHQLFMQAQQATYITENMLDRAVITDTENTVLVWNKRCEEAYNIKKEAATGKNIFELLPHLKNSEDLGLFNRALEGETIFLPQSKSGSGQEYHDLHLIPLKDEDGNVSGILHLLHDVTKEREMQQRLRERLNFIESLVEASVDRILVMDRYMNYLYCNQKAADYYKIRKEDIIGKNVLEVFPASVNDPTHDHFRKALKGETVHIPAIEGLSEAHYYEVFLIPIKDESEAVSAVLWIHHDLSGEIIMQRELRKSHQILNTVDAVFIELDHDDRIVYVNDSAKSYLNDTGEELSGKVIWEVLPGAEGSKEQEVILRAHTEKQITEAEYFSKHHNRWVFISVVPSADDGLIVFLYDRQDIKEIEQKLAEEHRRLKEAQAIGHIGSFEWNAATDTIHWSDEMFRIHGLEPQSETPTLERVLSFIYPQDDKETAAKLVQYRNEAAAATLTYKIKRPDGAIRVVTRQLQSFADAAGAVTHLSGTLQDVTEQVLASETIQQMLDGSIAAICLLDSVRNEEGGIIDFIFKGCNKAAERLNQIPAEAITGQRLLELFPGVKNVFFDGYVQVVESGLPLREQRYYPYEHYNHWFDVSAVKNGDGIIMTFYDITAQKIAEQELNESKAFTEEITRTTPDLITIHDAVSNKIIYANHGKLWSNKLTEDEVLAAPDDQRIALLIHPDDQGKAKDFMQQRRLLADGDILEVELRNQFGDQQWGHVKIRSKVFKRDAAGNAIQIISFTTNITTQRRHEDELFKNLNLLKQAEEVAGMGSWEYRIAEDKMTWSEGMYQLFDIKPGSNVKKETYLDHVLKEDRPVAKSFIKKLSAGAESIDETLSITFKSTGVRKIIRIKGTVVKDQNGNPERVLGVDLDITDLQRTEEQLRALNRSLDLRNKELQAKNEELASFSFIASHDLREPLRKIHTFSDWLLQSEREHLTETGKNYLDRMAASVKRMDRLINDVLVLTKLQTLPLTPEAVDLNALVNTVKAELAQSIRQTKTTLESDALPVITGDRAQLQHLLQNLLSNAITFQKPGNTPVVAITTRTVTATEAMALGLDANRSYARICVADNGIGFDKSYEHKIFQIFQRLHARSEYEGTGIGLTICKKVIENHKGTITADSTPGKGSLFCCYLPVDIP